MGICAKSRTVTARGRDGFAAASEEVVGVVLDSNPLAFLLK